MMALLLMAGGAMQHAWATDVTYHILTLPIDNSIYHMKDVFSGKRLEAVKVTAKGQSTLELPAAYKSPLATGFTYYAAADVTKSGSAVKQFDNSKNPNKAYYYTINGGATPVAEGSAVSGDKADYYVVYTYNASNPIAKLDGSVRYNIKTIGYSGSNPVEKGFLALNRGRNNRPAVLPKTKVDPDMLSDEDFVKVDLTDTKVADYWTSGDNKNKKELTGSKFFFMFKFEGVDPYNILIKTAYAKDTTYIEKNDGSSDFVYKYYKEGSLFSNGTANCYIASDEHIHYNKTYDSSLPENPTDLTEGSGSGYDAITGYYHGQTGAMWNSFALLNNEGNSGYVFMGTRNVNTDGAIPDAPNFLIETNTCNNLVVQKKSVKEATNNLTIEGIYSIKKLTFKVATPFYKVEATSDHIISVSDWVASYIVDTIPIESKYLPEALKRKYIEFNGKFYRDAACTQQITYFSEANFDNTEGYQVYVGYDVTRDAPKFLSPSASYTTATWYELTDEGSVQESGRKIKYDAGSYSYKNNGANGEYVKESEFALVGDPYELKVLSRSQSSYVTLSTHDAWEIPDDETAGSFLLREYQGSGYWYWDAGHPSPVDVDYSTKTHTYNVASANAQTVTFNVSNLDYTENDYIRVTAGGTNPGQVTLPGSKIYVQTDGTASFAAAILSRGDADKTFTLSIQKYNASDVAQGDPSVITVNQNNADYIANTVAYSTTNSTRVKVMDLPQYTYTYHIVDKSGRIAVKASALQPIFSTLTKASLPPIIVSPYILDENETVTFYDSYTDRNEDSKRSRLDFHNPTEQSAITETPATAADIYVTYTTTRLDNKPIKLDMEQEFNVVLNGEYLWYDSSDGSIKTTKAPSTDDLKLAKYLWKLRNQDPYAMLIDNLGARDHLEVSGNEDVTFHGDNGTPYTESREKGAWVKLASIANEGALSFDEDRADAQPFIAKSSNNLGVYEVMVATGDGVNAATTYYNIGRPRENEVKIYDQAHYTHGSDVLRFNLEQTIGYVYHLIDKSNHELLVMTSQNPELALPGDYQSPLVARYHYYDPNQINIAGELYTVKPAATELSRLSDLNAIYEEPVTSDAATWAAAPEGHKLVAATIASMREMAKQSGATGHYYFKIDEDDTYYDVVVTKPFYNHIYVTYDKNDLVTFGTNSPYMLRFLEPHADGYYLEDGNDGLTAGRIQAIYPYCNGDGNLNIYGDDMQKEQMGGGASTRPRWVWYFTSATQDPYHVRIHSRSAISYKGVSNPTYLQTYAVHFNQDAEAKKQRIVTGGTLPGVASEIPTEYMVLGSRGAYKLMTTEPVRADLNGDGDTSDDGENERQKVTSLEQYWKTYNMVKLNVLSVSASTDEYSDDAATWVVPTAPASYRATLEEKDWHSYTAYANAVRWNGYNDKTDGHEKKVVEQIEHWYQTFDMGNGAFDIESADIPPVLVLLDMHGWEIMRLPLPTANYPEGDDELAALRAYDSPLVMEYKFYSNATKASGCHKYSLRMQNGAERDQIKVNGKHYTSHSLGDLPPITATGVKSGGLFNDQFVTYTVKEEYAKSYQYTYNAATGAETETPSTFIIVHNGRFYKTPNSSNASYFSKPVYEHTPSGSGNVYDMILDPRNTGQISIVDGSGNWKGNCLWYIKPNQNIDKDMGIKYATVEGKTGEPWTEQETKKYYYDNGKSGFDPYNLQIQLLKNDNGTDNLKYLTSHQTSTRLENGRMIGSYDGSGGTTSMTLATGYDYTGWDAATATGNEGYDHTNLTITNQTFMAVSDAHGNMQLMPRFDHNKRVSQAGTNPWESSLDDPSNHTKKASAAENSSMGPQTVFFVRPLRLEYHIMDNEGRESLRYKRSGDDYPAVTEHFKSPLAKDYTYYKGLAESDAATASTEEEWTAADAAYKRSVSRGDLDYWAKLLPDAGTYYFRINTSGVITYQKVTVTEGLMEKQIKGALAAEGDLTDVYVRYNYDGDADHDADRILEGKWFTVQLANKDLKSSETRVVPTLGDTQGTGVSLYEGSSKPSPVDEDDKTWQWKFLAAPTDSTSDYYVAPDPYAVQLFNRYANYSATPTEEPSPMAAGIKVPNANNGADRFALLSHPSGGYAMAVAGTGNYSYLFLNGASMTTSVAAITAAEAGFTQKTGTLTAGAQLTVNNDVKHNFEYRVINNAKKLAVSVSQADGDAEAHDFSPYLPESAQTPLLDMEDYSYYGFAAHTVATDTYDEVPQTLLFTLYGLYDDIVWVRYKDYHVDSTSFKIPNKKTVVDSKVARDPASVDVSLHINGELPYNIVWENNNMMQSTDNENISDGGSQSLSGTSDFVWYITGNDPYALKIRHKGGKYVDGDANMSEEGGAREFMLLKKSGYDYGILQETGGTNRLSGYGQTMVAGDPTKFIIFGLSVHDLIYRLVIARTCTEAEQASPAANQYMDIPYRSEVSGAESTKRIYGSTQRDLSETYQLGTTLSWGDSLHTYCFDAGAVSIGDDLEVPNVFNRPNCTFDFYIAGIYDGSTGNVLTDLESKYKGLKLKKLMSDDKLIDETVVVNIVYSFNQELATNNGMDFVRSINDKCWYTFETTGASTPYLAHYTNVRGLQTMAGRETRYTNDYLWTPLGDVYGFKMYNRYMIKNSDGSGKMMTYAGTASEAKSLVVAEPGTGTYTSGNEIFELLPGDQDGYFRVHPVVNNSGTQYYVKRDASSENYVKLSTTPSDWTFGLSMSLMEPYYQRAGYAGGLTETGKTAYETARTSGTIMDIQHVVYDDANIIPFTTGYYRLHNQPGVSGISPVRYASGYLHEIEKKAEAGGIPMHFYSREGRNTTFAGEDGLRSGFTETNATRGDIPVPATESDPSTIFYINGNTTANPTISTATMSTQGLNVLGNKMTTGAGTTFTLIDIGAAVFLVVDKLDPATRNYLNFDQTSAIYDLKFNTDPPTDDAKWCLQPVQKTAEAGNGEMPLMLATNQGGDGYYYATFYAPYDVLLPDDGGGKTYNAYVCKTWHNEGVNPALVPATGLYGEGKLIPVATPVIIRTNDESESLTLTLPSDAPSSALSCALTGSYMEQLLEVDATRDVYTLGLPMVSEVSKAGDYVTSGNIVAPLPEFASTGVGFYINATRNKEADPLEALWHRNNLYVLHNKIYYRASGSPSPAPGRNGSVYVPVLFDEEQPDEEQPDNRQTVAGDGCVYDLLGRKVATKEDVQSGMWLQRLAPGIYIVEGKKICIR